MGDIPNEEQTLTISNNTEPNQYTTDITNLYDRVHELKNTAPDCDVEQEKASELLAQEVQDLRSQILQNQTLHSEKISWYKKELQSLRSILQSHFIQTKSLEQLIQSLSLDDKDANAHDTNQCCVPGIIYQL